LTRTLLLQNIYKKQSWLTNYKPKVPGLDGQTKPHKFFANYKTTVVSVGDNVVAPTKLFILIADGIAHD